MARNRRISDNDRHWGPFTLAKCGSYRSFGAHLDSGAGEYPGCNFNVLVGRWWFRVDLPPIIKPWRQWVDMTKYAWASGAGYWDEHARKYGIGLSPDGRVHRSRDRPRREGAGRGRERAATAGTAAEPAPCARH